MARDMSTAIAGRVKAGEERAGEWVGEYVSGWVGGGGE